MKVIDIYKIIDKIAPFENQDKGFDNSCLNVGDFDAEVKKICVAIDITLEVIEEAVKEGANLIISHHPVLFNPAKSVLKGTPVYELVKHEISAICAHTNYDVARKGMSDIMLEKLDFPQDGEVLETFNSDGTGYGKCVVLPQSLTARELSERAKKAFLCTIVRCFDSGKNIKKIAVCSGSGASEIALAKANKCDALITGDVAWNRIVEASNIGITLIDAGHFHTENIFCERILNQLSEHDIPPIFIAQNSRDLCSYF